MQMAEFLPTDIAIKIIVGFAVGALIGLERQKVKEEQPLGLRSFGLLSLLGTISIIITMQVENLLFLIYTTSITLFLVFMYTIFKMYKEKEWGVTTSIVFSTAFLLGVLVGYDNGTNNAMITSISISIFITFVLSIKEEVQKFVKELTYTEIVSALELGILSLLLYPLIPETLTDPFFHVIQLQTLYFLLLLLLGIMFVNYIFIKKYAYKGIVVFGFFGGLVNSEATVTSISEYYKTTKSQCPKCIRIGALLANSAMLIRNLFITWLLDPTPTKELVVLVGLPFGLFLIFSSITVFATLDIFAPKEGEKVSLNITSPFSMKTAIEFVGIFTIITFISIYMQRTFSTLGLYVASFFGGFANAGAITLAAATLVARGDTDVVTAGISILLANIAAIFNKLIYVRATKIKKNAIRYIFRDATVFLAIVALYAISVTYILPFLSL